MVFAINHLLAHRLLHAYDTTKQGVLFKSLSKKAVVAKFDQDHASSDGGAVLLKACDEKLEVEHNAGFLLVGRSPAVEGLALAARSCFSSAFSAIACGYADGATTPRDWPTIRL